MKNYLPLGSIVTLKGGSKKMMIYGRAQVARETGKMFDYVACLYPQGFFKPDMLLCFNEDQIEEVIFTGYTDEDETLFVQRMNALVEERMKPEEPEQTEQTEQQG